MRAIGIIAGGVFRDSIRDRIAYGLVFFAVLLMASSFLLAQLTAGQDVKIIKDLGLAAASAIGLFIAMFFGIGLVTKEVERRSIYSLISKPVTRTQFVIGKYLGLVLTLLINLVGHGDGLLRRARVSRLDDGRGERRRRGRRRRWIRGC